MGAGFYQVPTGVTGESDNRGVWEARAARGMAAADHTQPLMEGHSD